MSKTSENNKNDRPVQDPLSALLRRLEFSANVFLRADFCGRWAVDTSGERRIPFHLVTQGEGWLHLPNSKPTHLRAGHLVLFPHDSQHLLASSETVPDPSIINAGPPTQIEGDTTSLVCGYFSFDQRSATPLLNSMPTAISLNLNESHSGLSSNIVQSWMAEAANNTLGSDAAVDLLAQVIFIHVLRAEVANDSLHGVIEALSDSKLGTTLAAIHQSPGDDHSIERLANNAGMSESAFNHRFKRLVDMTPAQYVRHWRLHTAAQWLRDTERSMGDIAESVGYESEAAFRKAFRNFFGETPGMVRRGG